MENQNQQPQYQQTVVIVGKQKSVGVAFILAFLFGPLGLFYASVIGGIVMLILSGLVAIFTLGLGLLITWPICIIWAMIAASNANKKLTSGASLNINSNYGNPPIQQPPTTQTVNPQPQVQQQYIPPVQKPPSPTFSEQMAPFLSSIGDFISKNKILLISAVVVITIIFSVYTLFLKKDPSADGKKAALAICDCYKEQNDKLISIYNKYISDFDSYKFSSRQAARNKLEELKQSVNSETQRCIDISQEKYSELKSNYITEREEVEKFDYAYNAQQQLCNSSNELSSLDNVVSSKINNYMGREEKEQARQDSIIAAQTAIAFANAKKNIPSSDRMKQDLLGKKLRNINGGNLSNEDGSWTFERGEIKSFNITSSSIDNSTSTYKGNIEMELLGARAGRCHTTAIIEYTWEPSTNTWHYKNIVSVEFHRIR